MRPSFVVFMCLILSGFTALVHADTFYVQNIPDDGTGTVTGTLSKAITDSNNKPGFHSIAFNLSYQYAGITITATTMPPITKQVSIFGGTQYPVIMGNSSVSPLTCAGSNNTIQNVAIINSANGIWLKSGSGDNSIQGCRLGIDWNNIAHGNYNGILVEGSGNYIDGTAAAGPNVISGNSSDGVAVDNCINLWVHGNLIGTDSTGTLARSNTWAGVDLGTKTSQALIGGTTAADSNVISGNTQNGVIISTYAFGNTVCGNYIGTNSSNTSLGNQKGIHLNSSSGNYIGLPVSHGANVIACNQNGLYLEGTGGFPSSNNFIQNNYIGTNASNALLGNSQAGIDLESPATHNLIGGLRGGALLNRNIIMNNQNGITLNADQNTLCGNYIGCDEAGAYTSGNLYGIQVNGFGNLIGGPNPSGTLFNGNVLSGNSGSGVYLGGGGGNTVAGNFIGPVSAVSTTTFPNNSGVYIFAGKGNYIGGTTPNLRNIISGNVRGIRIDNSGGNIVAGNYIGTDYAGASLVKNTSASISMYGATGCRIGGTNSGERNIICGDDLQAGIEINGGAGNTVAGNWFGLLPNGAFPSENLLRGIYLTNSTHDNALGLKSLHTGNLIYGTQSAGIAVGDSTACINNGLYGNTICGFSSGEGILLQIMGGVSKTAPTITAASTQNVGGSCTSGDFIEVFLSDRGTGVNGGSLRYLGSILATSSSWNVDVSGQGLVNGRYVCALASDSANNTSAFSMNHVLQDPTFTPTPSATASPTATPSATDSPTATATPSATVSPTVTATASISPTTTVSPTITLSPTVTPTGTQDRIQLNGKAVLAFPNPAKNTMTFALQMDRPGEVKVALFNSAGERAGLVKAQLGSGVQTLTWNCGQAAPGIYFAQILREGKEVAKIKVAVAR